MLLKTRAVTLYKKYSVYILHVSLIALFTAGSQTIIPLPFNAVPFSLQPLPIYAAAYVWGWHAIFAYGSYLLLGAAGAPVFSAFRGGLLHLAGPTGGYLWGFLLGAALIALSRHITKTTPKLIIYFAAACTHFFFGLAQLSLFIPQAKLVALGLSPFLIGDFIIKPLLYAALCFSYNTAKTSHSQQK